MGEGWETARRRDDGNDWVELAARRPGTLRVAEIDTTLFVGNAPGWARLTGVDGSARAIELLPRTRLQPDTRHRFRLGPTTDVGSVRLDIYPDGGVARLRLWGSLSRAGREALVVRWYDALPAGFARALLVAEARLADDEAAAATLLVPRVPATASQGASARHSASRATSGPRSPRTDATERRGIDHTRPNPPGADYRRRRRRATQMSGRQERPWRHQPSR